MPLPGKLMLLLSSGEGGQQLSYTAGSSTRLLRHFVTTLESLSLPGLQRPCWLSGISPQIVNSRLRLDRKR